jgi:hypothetical protein
MDSATSLSPAIVLLELGGNNGLRGLPWHVTRKNGNHDHDVSGCGSQGSGGITLPTTMVRLHQISTRSTDLARGIIYFPALPAGGHHHQDLRTSRGRHSPDR